jgi:hypothetical protein
MTSIAKIAAALVTTAPAAPSAADDTRITVYKSPTCGCCTKWVAHL